MYAIKIIIKYMHKSRIDINNRRVFLAKIAK